MPDISVSFEKLFHSDILHNREDCNFCFMPKKKKTSKMFVQMFLSATLKFIRISDIFLKLS